MAQTSAERKAAERERKKKRGIIPYSCEIHEGDKEVVDAFIKKLKLARSIVDTPEK